ncbi:hypothetical protein CBS101457_005811 [Exobasidium rhododendri]|nr:hypothetical protein CBS101457_005811 [Exobasidium rhododendri]
MLNSIIHQPCEVTLHLYSSDLFIHPPRPNSELPGNDKTLTGLVEIRSPSERTIQGIKVTLTGAQTLVIPESLGQINHLTTRYEEKTLMEKTVEINAETVQTTSLGKGKGKERVTATTPPSAVTTSEEAGIHLDKGLHGFEFAFIIPASSAPFERAKNGRVRYTLTATALGAGRGKSPVTVSREIFIVLQVNSDGGPTPLDIQYHDIHEALGALSVSLTSASLTVGGTANFSLHHPTPPAGLSVHVARVFMEQTVELYSELRKSWMKLPVEKLRLWERGYMPYKDRAKQVDPNSTMEDCLWLRAEDGISQGRPGRGATNNNQVTTISPFGIAINGSNSHGGSGSHTPAGTPGLGTSYPTTPGGTLTPTNEGYKLKSVIRLPDDNTIRPSTVRGSRADIRISHELGVEIFFSRVGVLDERESSESYGKPKIQVFSMRRATIVPTCLATFDTIHLPPYTFESPVHSRPPSPTQLHSSSFGSNGNSGGRGGSGGPGVGALGKSPSQVELEYWKLTQSLRAALPHASGGASLSAPITGVHSAERSNPASLPTSRSSSPTRHNHSHGHGHGLFGRSKSRPASPTGGSSSNHHQQQQHQSGTTSPPHTTGIIRKGVPNLHALTPANPAVSTTLPTVITAPGSGATTPKSLPANSPWAISNLPPRTSTSHATCQCGRSTEELVEAEHKLMEGAATAPGIFSDAHDVGQLPPPWTPSRPSSPTDEQVTGWITQGSSERDSAARMNGKIGGMS